MIKYLRVALKASLVSIGELRPALSSEVVDGSLSFSWIFHGGSESGPVEFISDLLSAGTKHLFKTFNLVVCSAHVGCRPVAIIAFLLVDVSTRYNQLVEEFRVLSDVLMASEGQWGMVVVS
jgi:hypothetical protein